MQRIMIIGCGGAGKSTLARQLHKITGLPLIHLDQHFWNPNWVETQKAIWTRKVQTMTEQASWIIDGNYGGTMDLRLEKADTIIFLNRSRWTCLRRVLYRTIVNYGRTRPDMPEGCHERFSWEFLWYVFHYNQTRRPGILKRLAERSPDQRIFNLQNQKAIDQMLQVVRQKFQS